MNDAGAFARCWQLCVAVVTLMMLSGSARAVDHSGTCTGTYAAVQNPHRLIGTCTVPSGQTLTLEAGVVLVGQNNSIQVQSGGTLNITGTSAAQRDVQLTNALIQFNAGSAGEVKNCTIANANLSYGVYITDASPTVMDCTITGASYGIYVTGSSLVTPAAPSLTGNTITPSSIGIGYGASAGGTASGNTISFPTGATSGRVGIDVSADADPVLDGNTFGNDTTESDVGIRLDVDNGVAVQVKNNVFHASGGDRVIDLTPNVFGGAGPTITGNQFPDGIAAGIGLRGTLTTGTATIVPVQGQNTFNVTSTISVNNDATLNVAAGVTLDGHNNSIQVANGGTFNAVGTSAAQRDVQLMDIYPQFNAGSAGQLKNCVIDSPSLSYAVYIADASPTVMSCTITAGAYGIYVTGSSPVTPAQPLLSGNTITASSIGILYNGNAGGTASGNTIGFPIGATSGRVGIHVSGNAAPVLDGNTILDDTIEADVGIELATNVGVAVQVTNNVIHASGNDRVLQLAPDVFGGGGPTFTGNQFPDGIAAGIGVHGTVTGTATIVPVQGQSTFNVTSTISVSNGATLNVAAGVTLDGHNNSIQVANGGTFNAVGTSAAQRDVELMDIYPQFNAGSAGQLKNCVIESPSLSYAVYIADASPTVMSCTITAASYGIYVTGSSQVTPAQPLLSGNTITASSIGILYNGNAGGTASGNTIGFPIGATSGRVGIHVSGNAAPVVDGNTILDDTIEADVGIELATNVGVAVQVTNNIIHASGNDRVLQLEPDVFGGAGPTIMGNQFPDGIAAGIGLHGTLTGTATIVPVQGQSTFNVTSTISVSNGATLNVAAGVTLAGHNNSIQVANGGTFNAVGTSAAQRDVQLMDIYPQFNAGSAGQLKNCVIENPSLSYGVYIADASPTVMSCTITAGAYGIYVTGSSQVTPAQPLLSGNTITASSIGIVYNGNAGGTASANMIGFPIGATSGRVGIQVSGNAVPVLDGNTILDDTTEADVGIDLQTNVGVAVQVTNNVIHASGSDRLIDLTPNVFGGAGPMITGNTFPDGPAGGFGLSGSLTDTATIAPVQGVSTFNLTSTISVGAGATLNIEAGVTLAGRNNSIQVQNGGILNAVGTGADQRDVQLLNVYVQFHAGSGGQLENCIIDNPTLSYGIYITDASPTVMSCTINGASYGITIGGSSQAAPAAPQIAGSRIDAGNIAIDISGTAQPIIEDNTLTLNAVAIQIGAGASVPTVVGNTFDRNTLSLAFTREDALFSSLPSTFDDNTFSGRADQNLIDLGFNSITQSGTIQATKVPYRTSGLTIQNGVTLTLEPGVVFDHTSFASLVVNGDLVAIGTAERPIIFTAQSAKSGTRWRGVVLNDQSPSSSSALESCIVEFVGPNQTALRLDNSFAAIRNSTITANDGDGIEITNGAEPEVSDTTVAQNGGDGVIISSGGLPHFSGGTIFHNDGLGMRSEDCPDFRNIVSAERVYWGDDSGPLDGNNDSALPGGLFNPTGHGSAVTDCIDYDPWTRLGPSVEGTLAAKSGGGQSGPPGSLLPQPLCVEVKSTLGSALPNIDVTFSVAEGDGDIETPQPVSTAANGEACVSFRLGMAPGTNRVTATARDVNSPLATFDTQTGGAASSLFVLTVRRSTVRPARFALGDMNDDGQLSIADAALIEAALMAEGEPGPAIVGHGDVNDDGAFDRGDERVMLDYLVKHAAPRLKRPDARQRPIRAYVRRPASSTLVGEVLRVPVYLRYVRDRVAGYELQVQYDADALELLAVDAGSTPGFDEAPITNGSSAVPGRLRFAAVNRGMLSTHRTVHVATLVFRARAPGKTGITVSAGSRIPVVTVPGFEARSLLGKRTTTILVR